MFIGMHCGLKRLSATSSFQIAQLPWPLLWGQEQREPKVVCPPGRTIQNPSVQDVFFQLFSIVTLALFALFQEGCTVLKKKGEGKG